MKREKSTIPPLHIAEMITAKNGEIIASTPITGGLGNGSYGFMHAVLYDLHNEGGPHYGNQGGTPGASVRDGDWKLIRFFEDGHEELYNLKEDIG